MGTRDIATASEDSLINLCHKAEEEGGLIGGYTHGDRVIKISDEIAVKYGMGVDASEAATQDFAYRNLDHNLVHVPQVRRFIESDTSGRSRGYLFMEYIPGQNLQEIDLESHPDLPRRIAQIVTHLGQIQGPTPGPIGGEPVGYIWGDGAKTPFRSVADMNAYMNTRLQYRGDSIDLTPHPLVLCHGDLCRRNIILEPDGSICLVDWGFAGFYPRFFEIAAISCMLIRDRAFEDRVTSEIEEVLGLTDEERGHMKLVLCVRAANLRWTFNKKTPSEYEAWRASMVEMASRCRGMSSAQGEESGLTDNPRIDEGEVDKSENTMQSGVGSVGGISRPDIKEVLP